MVEDDAATFVDWQVDAAREGIPAVGVGSLQAAREGRRFLQHPRGGHVHVGVVVDRIGLFGDADHLFDFVAAFGFDHAARDPIGDALEYRPGFFAEVVFVPGRVHILGKCERDAQADVLLKYELGR